MTDLFGMPTGKRTERVEWGQRFIRDCVFAEKGEVRSAPGEDSARGYDGAFYPGGVKTFVPVRRTVTTIAGEWEPA